MKNLKLLFSILFSFCIVGLYAQTQMSIGAIEDDTLIVNSGSNYLLIPQIDDGEAGLDQDITITAQSNINAVIEVTSVEYNTGDNFAVIRVDVKDSVDDVVISITADDGDGQVNTSMNVTTVPYSKPGCNWGVFDMVFWQQNNPFGETPTYDTVIATTDFNQNSVDWSQIVLNVSVPSGACTWCDGHDFNTTMLSGYIVPPASGTYRFYHEHQNEDQLWLSTDENFNNCQKIIATNDPTVGADMGSDTWRSDLIALEGGKIYAFYAPQWNVHQENSKIYWESATITKSIIPSENLMYIYDPEIPVLRGGIEIFKKGDEDFHIIWPEGTDNDMLAGYNVYVDGLKVNSGVVNDTSYLVSGLIADTKYSVVITAVDNMGNESDLSNILTTSTYPTDGVDPNAPTNVQTTDKSGLAVAISWDAATDGETEIRGYDVYVDGVKNNSGYIYETSYIISELDPSTSYDITVVAIDAGYNESAASTTLTEETDKYSVGDNMGIPNGQLSINMKTVSWNNGIGINPPDFHKSGEAPDALFLSLMDEFQPGNYRLMWDWSTAGSCDDYVAPELITGPSLPYTIGDFMNIANSYDAYALLSISLQQDAVFHDGPEYFDYLLEYFCGPSTTTWGTEREWEGYTEPLIDNCRGLVIEFGNEVWGGDGHCIPLGEDYDEYAQWCRDMDARIKASPYYDPEKIFTCYSGRNPSPWDSYGLNESLYTNDNGTVDWVALSGYMGGNFDYSPAVDPGKSELDYLKNGVQSMVSNIEGLGATKQDMLALAGEIKPIWFYESNMTTPIYNGRFGQALIMTDYWAGSMEEGVIVSAFSMYGGQWKIYNENWGKRLPLFHTAAFFNNHCKGHILETELVSTSKIYNSNGVEIEADPIGTYAYSDDSTMVLFLINRNFEKNAFVQINLEDTLTFNASATQYIFTSDHYSSYDTDIDTVPLTLTDSMMVKVPAGGMVFVKVKGLTQKLEKKDLAAYEGFTLATDIEVTCQGECLIEDDGGILFLDATVTPPDAFITSVNWEIVDGDVQGGVYQDNTYLVKASSLCSGNGTATIRAYSPGNETVYDEITITITGQVDPGGCPTSIAAKEFELDVYPNPANNIVNISASHVIKTVRITDISGKTMLLEQVENKQHQLDVSTLANGMFILEVQFENNEKAIEKILIQ